MSVFISFVHEEQEVAATVQQLLVEKLRREFAVFLSSDRWQMLAGQVWLDRIREELNGARVIVSLLSPRSIGRPWVNFEAGAAWLSNKPIIPACFGGLDLGQLPRPYSDFQAVDLRAHDYELVSGVLRCLDAHRIPPVPWAPDDPLRQDLHRALDNVAT